MDTAVNATVGTALALQNFNQDQQVQNSLLKKSLDGQASHIAQLMSSVSPSPELASSGSVGTQINTYA
ncbi:putative motility protein [Salinicola corii]|uniref:Putative motility protein n=1 Tax=Salinicola corii TaxID=2606937 RepID=A0A640WBI2_9GAMM|nr:MULTISPECIES: putative motility protein [Salinicola]KAA0016877.1 putative motility protein [Salinicola corii]MAM58233.1 hypothetical protein [Salinicola sp.]NRB57650.1 putative motility protein [Salinicola sp.]